MAKGVVVLKDFNRIDMTVKIRLSKQFKVRVWIALRLMGLAARVLRCGFNVEELEDA